MKLIFVSTVLLASFAGSQIISAGDAINFSTAPSFTDLRECLRAVFTTDFNVNNGPVQNYVGCEDNACLCRPDTESSAAVLAGSMALSQCSDSDDAMSATSVLAAYCSVKGYTSALPSSGAAAATTGGPVTVYATTTVAQATVTVTVQASSAAVPLAQPNIMNKLLGAGAAVAFALLPSAAFLLQRRRLTSSGESNSSDDDAVDESL